MPYSFLTNEISLIVFACSWSECVGVHVWHPGAASERSGTAPGEEEEGSGW